MGSEKSNKQWKKLSPFVAVSDALSLLGRIVENPESPLDAFTPDIDREASQDTKNKARRRVQQLVEVIPYKLKVTRASESFEQDIFRSAEAHIEATKLAGGGLKSTSEAMWGYKTSERKIFGLAQYDQVLAAVAEKYKDPIEVFFKDHPGRVYMMVSLFTAVDAETSESRVRDRDVSARLTVPVGSAVTGSPDPVSSNLDISGSAGSTVSASKALESTHKGEAALMAQYVELKTGRGLGGYVRRKFGKGGVRRKRNAKLTFGDSDVEDQGDSDGETETEEDEQ